jgi:hypothetical protein
MGSFYAVQADPEHLSSRIFPPELPEKYGDELIFRVVFLICQC